MKLVTCMLHAQDFVKSNATEIPTLNFVFLSFYLGHQKRCSKDVLVTNPTYPTLWYCHP